MQPDTSLEFSHEKFGCAVDSLPMDPEVVPGLCLSGSGWLVGVLEAKDRSQDYGFAM